MSPRDWFGVIVRIIGLGFVGTGCIVILEGMYAVFSFGQDSLRLPSTFVWIMGFAGVGIILLGLYMLKGAPRLINFAYPKKAEQEG